MVNSTIGDGIVRCRSERCRNQWARPLDRGTGAPAGERQEKIRTPALTTPRLRELIAGVIEEHLKVNDPEKQERRGTRWQVRSEYARFYYHHSRNILPPLKNRLRL